MEVWNQTDLVQSAAPPLTTLYRIPVLHPFLASPVVKWGEENCCHLIVARFNYDAVNTFMQALTYRKYTVKVSQISLIQSLQFTKYMVFFIK
jgi:hypothetical protein